MKLPDQKRTCKVHGITDFVHEPSKGKTGYRCRRCRVEHVTRKRQELKKKLVEHLGGKCSKCGYSNCMAALHFHHLHGKDSSISSLIGAYRATKVWQEIDKCVLLCANCHAEEHWMEPVGIEPTSPGLQPGA